MFGLPSKEIYRGTEMIKKFFKYLNSHESDKVLYLITIPIYLIIGVTFFMVLALSCLFIPHCFFEKNTAQIISGILFLGVFPIVICHFAFMCER